MQFDYGRKLITVWCSGGKQLSCATVVLRLSDITTTTTLCLFKHVTSGANSPQYVLIQAHPHSLQLLT